MTIRSSRKVQRLAESYHQLLRCCRRLREPCDESMNCHFSSPTDPLYDTLIYVSPRHSKGKNGSSLRCHGRRPCCGETKARCLLGRQAKLFGQQCHSKLLRKSSCVLSLARIRSTNRGHDCQPIRGLSPTLQRCRTTWARRSRSRRHPGEGPYAQVGGLAGNYKIGVLNDRPYGQRRVHRICK